jgi:hypothetical protein
MLMHGLGLAEIHLDLNNKFGELTICVASSAAFAGDAVESTNRAGQHLGPRLAMLSNAVQATQSWKSLGICPP